MSFLVVRPLKGYSCTAESTFVKFWKRHKRGLDVGHRGAGNARRTDIKKDTDCSAKVRKASSLRIGFDERSHRNRCTAVFQEENINVS